MNINNKFTQKNRYKKKSFFFLLSVFFIFIISSVIYAETEQEPTNTPSQVISKKTDKQSKKEITKSKVTKEQSKSKKKLTDKKKKKPKKIVFNGKVSIGSFAKAKIEIYKITKGKSALFPEEKFFAISDENGEFLISLPPEYKDLSFILKADFSDFKIKDIASKEDIVSPRNFVLRSIVSKVVSKDFISITPLTELATRKALFFGELLTKKKIKYANEFVSDAFSDDKKFDILKIKPVHPFKPIPKKTDKNQKEYGLLIAAISNYVLKNSDGERPLIDHYSDSMNVLSKAINNSEKGLGDIVIKDVFKKAVLRVLGDKANKTGITAKKTSIIKEDEIEEKDKKDKKKDKQKNQKKEKSKKAVIDYVYDYVNAGKDLKKIKEDSLISLKASLTKGFKSKNIKSISWVNIVGDVDNLGLIKLKKGDTLAPTFVAPSLNKKTKFVFKVTITDSFNNDFFDIVSVEVLKSNLYTPEPVKIINEDDNKDILNFKFLKKHKELSPYDYEYRFSDENVWHSFVGDVKINRDKTQTASIKVGNKTRSVKIRVKEKKVKKEKKAKKTKKNKKPEEIGNTSGYITESTLFLHKPIVPTLKVADDSLDIVEFYPTENYKDPRYYKYSLDEGKTWKRASDYKIGVENLTTFTLIHIGAVKNKNVASNNLKTIKFSKTLDSPVEIAYSDKENFTRFAPVKDFPLSSQYEYSIDKGKNWQPVKSFIIKVGNLSGHALVRVKAVMGKNGAGRAMKSSNFTSHLLAPKEKFFNDDVDVFEFSPASGYDDLSYYECMLPESTTWFKPNSFILNVGDIEGNVYVRIIGSEVVLKSSKFTKKGKDVSQKAASKSGSPVTETIGSDKEPDNYMTIGVSDGSEAVEKEDDLPTPPAPTYSLLDDETNKLIIIPVEDYTDYEYCIDGVS
ncbi:MAG: hypothetical protein ACTSXL_00220, partial [Alphaproteobacteria bacterium]